jgi:hypothetical protein
MRGRIAEPVARSRYEDPDVMNPPAHVVHAEIMDRARRTNRERDRIDKLTGCQVPRDGGAGPYLAAAISAIDCGLLVHDWASVAEGLAMLHDLQATFLPRAKKKA